MPGAPPPATAMTTDRTPTTPTSAATVGEQSRLAHMLADSLACSVVALAPADTDGWRDVALLLNEHEFAPATRDLHSECLGYARLRGLITLHPTHRHLVRLTRPQA